MLATKQLIAPRYFIFTHGALRGATYRSISTSFTRRMADELKTTTPDELKTTTPYGNAAKGTEGGHQRELVAPPLVHAYMSVIR